MAGYLEYKIKMLEWLKQQSVQITADMQRLMDMNPLNRIELNPDPDSAGLAASQKAQQLNQLQQQNGNLMMQQNQAAQSQQGQQVMSALEAQTFQQQQQQPGPQHQAFPSASGK
jgi:hypothetical protein